MLPESDEPSSAVSEAASHPAETALRIIAFNHHFEQDLDAVEQALGPDDVLVSVPYQLLLRRARKSIEEKYFSELLQPAATSQELERYRIWLERRIRMLITLLRPNVVLLPSDTFFYVRPAIEEFRRHGISCVVLQKETTVTDAILENLAPEIGQNLPFISDEMLVCSERQLQFWKRAGTDPSKIHVVGQPRFDLYRELLDGSVGKRDSAKERRKRVLFLSFDSRAYIDTDTGNSDELTWDLFKSELADVLDSCQTFCDVLVKQHPQERADSVELEGRFQVAPRDADTRELIRECDVVVGFQTTALFEAALAGKTVLYPAWGKVWEQHVNLLIPFHHMDPAISWVTTPEGLRDILKSNGVNTGVVSDDALSVITEHLGEIDGGSSDRVVDLLRTRVGAGPPAGASDLLWIQKWPSSLIVQVAARRCIHVAVSIGRVALSLLARVGFDSPGRYSMERFFGGVRRALREG